MAFAMVIDCEAIVLVQKRGACENCDAHSFSRSKNGKPRSTLVRNACDRRRMPLTSRGEIVKLRLCVSQFTCRRGLRSARLLQKGLVLLLFVCVKIRLSARRSRRLALFILAETDGFEPSRGIAPSAAFPTQCLRPLSHISMAEAMGFGPMDRFTSACAFQVRRLKPGSATLPN